MAHSSRNIYTDLAIESREMLDGDEIAGVSMTVMKNPSEDICVTCVEILDETGEKQMGKPIGKYITLESEMLKINDMDAHEEIRTLLASSIAQLVSINSGDTVLVVGLGNWNVTPDALGPKVVAKVLVTRHIAEAGGLPESFVEDVRPVCAVSPGVMGITGIETAEIVKGIIEHVKPALVIAVDALAARRASRINATIQMSNTGVNPGAGMGNKRQELNEKTLGVPVVAIGVPTVVDAATLVNDTLDLMLDAIIQEAEEGAAFYDMLNRLESGEKYNIIKHVMDPFKGNMFVTPKEVDSTIDRLSGIIAGAVNIALQPDIDVMDINRFMY